jgi:hypothetical protein
MNRYGMRCDCASRFKIESSFPPVAANSTNLEENNDRRESRAFHPHTHCMVCKVRAANAVAGWEKIREPKRAHDDRCPKNRKTGGVRSSSIRGKGICLQ